MDDDAVDRDEATDLVDCADGETVEADTNASLEFPVAVCNGDCLESEDFVVKDGGCFGKFDEIAEEEPFECRLGTADVALDLFRDEKWILAEFTSIEELATFSARWIVFVDVDVAGGSGKMGSDGGDIVVFCAGRGLTMSAAKEEEKACWQGLI